MGHTDRSVCTVHTNPLSDRYVPPIVGDMLWHGKPCESVHGLPLFRAIQFAHIKKETTVYDLEFLMHVTSPWPHHTPPSCTTFALISCRMIYRITSSHTLTAHSRLPSMPLLLFPLPLCFSSSFLFLHHLLFFPPLPSFFLLPPLPPSPLPLLLFIALRNTDTKTDLVPKMAILGYTNFWLVKALSLLHLYHWKYEINPAYIHFYCWSFLSILATPPCPTRPISLS